MNQGKRPTKIFSSDTIDEIYEHCVISHFKWTKIAKDEGLGCIIFNQENAETSTASSKDLIEDDTSKKWILIWFTVEKFICLILSFFETAKSILTNR